MENVRISERMRAPPPSPVPGGGYLVGITMASFSSSLHASSAATGRLGRTPEGGGTC